MGLKKTLQWCSVKFSSLDCGFLLTRLRFLGGFLIHFIVCLPCVFSEMQSMFGMFGLEESNLFCGHMNSVLAAQ